MSKINYQAFQNEIVSLRRQLHSHPELSLHEKETSIFVEDYLNDLGLETTRIGDYGLVAMIWANDPSCKTVALRAEMDAIAVQEQNDFDFKSQNPGVMHACGHDAIMATVLVTAKLCVDNRELLHNNVKVFFQPAEENGKGTEIMIDGGVMNDPEVDYFTMLHFANDAPLGMELNKGASSAAIGAIKIRITGVSSHWALPDDGVDTIDVVGQILSLMNKIKREYVSNSPFILGIGKINGGSASNVIADETLLEGTLRAIKVSDYAKLRKLLLDGIADIQEDTKAQIEVEITDPPIPPIVSDAGLVDIGLRAGEEVFGNESRLVSSEYLSGDSAADYFNYARGVFFVFTAESENEKTYPLHNGRFDIDEGILWKAVAVLHRYILSL
ncbi:M20 metallopeptidase family protein [Companilactobacillus nodensis]|uniref:Amidohydrolase YhaA n=1 Tax=Companilactobacillus nodensis DSM 19682 = JCM 14932 = NBRC 107160 TaxID=1423775 RepID=A0A0R1KB42_9LACO|nr:M20 family metallopeptidase [Companilactobacillus nodensis]KRK78659.1 amidohydrolase YhaA [Companilactobacillus nodensis DSM 19682 = JCM 14932 = NBRC 107160]